MDHKLIINLLELALHHADMEIQYFKAAYLSGVTNIPFDVAIDMYKHHKKQKKELYEEVDRVIKES